MHPTGWHAPDSPAALALVAAYDAGRGVCVSCRCRPVKVVGGEEFDHCEACTPVTRPIVGTAPAGRNDRCPCGSGRKWKRCHRVEGKA